jgi:hypothetical protein
LTVLEGSLAVYPTGIAHFFETEHSLAAGCTISLMSGFVAINLYTISYTRRVRPLADKSEREAGAN